MAHQNIDERRFEVSDMLEQGFSHKVIKKVCSEKYKCTPSAIYSDLLYMKHGHKKIYISASQRKTVRERDNFTCQYCGIVNDKTGNVRFITEHIIPAQLGGPAREYNLVYACHGCNMKKRRKVWVPANIEAITIGIKYWKRAVKRLAVA